MRLAAALAAMLLGSSALHAAELRVLSSIGFAVAGKALAPEWERLTGNTLVIDWGPSAGATSDVIPQRVASGEKIDVLITVDTALKKLVDDGKVAGTDVVKLARAGIGVAVKQGAAVPDISAVGGLEQALLAAKSVAYSDDASGAYVAHEMFGRMGIEDRVKDKTRVVAAEPVGAVVARGDADIGLQEISELKPIKGIVLLGPLPASLQYYTVFAAGVLESSQEKEAARSLIRFLASPAAATTITNSGMEPAGPPK